MYTVAIVGLGARGYHTYARYQHHNADKMKIVAIADIDVNKVLEVKKEFDIADDMCFDSAEALLSQNKLADVIFIATQDRDHVRHALAALEKGYDILLEKPISPDVGECIELENKVKETGRLVAVCHVLRYAPFYTVIKEVIDSGIIGDIVTVDAIENVGYWHQAHSFVRGNWSNSIKTSPMILQKSCHDFDIISFLIGKKCISLSSYGSLKYFNADNKPKGSADYCYDCACQQNCPYDAYKIYLTNKVTGYKSGNTEWPCNIVADNPTEEKLIEALKRGRYGRCVYACDNNVVDHQITAMEFENGVTATFTMSAFSARSYREITIMGTLGEIRGNQDTGIITVTPFGKETIIYDINKLTTDLSGHGGGDNRMLTEFFDALESKKHSVSSTIENSMQSHFMAFAAEKSRLESGRKVKISELTATK